MNKKTLAIFDLDGTLIHSAPIVIGILENMRRSLGLETLNPEYYTPWLSVGGEQMMVNCLGVSDNEASIYLNKFRGIYMDINCGHGALYENVELTLKALKENNINIAICTNKPRALAERALIETGIDNFIEYMCAGGDLPTKKPSQENVDCCLNFFNVDSKNSILVGDSTVDYQLSQVGSIDFAFFIGGYNDGVDQKKCSFKFDNHKKLLDLFIK